MVNFSLIYKKKKIFLDVKVCKSAFSQGLGLMFRKKSKPLLFVFRRKTRMAIHSLFCVPFIAVWFMDNKIIDIQIIKPWIIHVVPGKRFNKLLEIPVNNENFGAVKVLIQK